MPSVTPPSTDRSIDKHPFTAHIQSRGRLFLFADLPTACQRALVHYMSVDGAAWAVEDAWEDWRWGEGRPTDLESRRECLADIDKFLSKFVSAYGKQLFGYVVVSVADLLECMRNCHGLDEFGCSNATPALGIAEYDTPTWPVILDGNYDGVLQDGHHRFAMYRKLSLDIPVVWYPSTTQIRQALDA